MSLIRWLINIFLLTFIPLVFSSHFRGRVISWRPLSVSLSGTTAQIQVRQRYSWRHSSVSCTDATIAARGLLSSGGTLQCYTGSCSTSAWGSGLTTNVYYTDYSIGGDLSSGERYDTITLPINTSISVGFISSAWLSKFVVDADSAWYVIDLINTIVRSDGFLNTSPVATTLSVIYNAAYTQHVHVVQMTDGNGGDILKCRWSISSTNNINSYNECGDVYSGVISAILSTNNCTLVFTLNCTAIYYVTLIS